MRAGIVSTAATLTVVVLVGCADSASKPHTVQGECADFYGTDICPWATLNGADSLIEFGITIPLAAVELAPDDMEMVWPPELGAIINMPTEVSAAVGVDHVTAYWEPHGHPPGPYLTPHFDFHFYIVSHSTREAIDCADPKKPTELPAGYGLVDVEIPGVGMLEGLCVPAMGMHALLASELESDALFDGTMVIGYTDGGAPLFFEPMITREMLMRRQSFELPMPTVSGVPEGARYPRRYRAEYDSATDAYRFIFSGS